MDYKSRNKESSKRISNSKDGTVAFNYCIRSTFIADADIDFNILSI